MFNAKVLHPMRVPQTAGVLGLLCATVFSLYGVSAQATEPYNCLGSPHWIISYTGRQINHTHIFCGELNRRGRLVGFHSRPDGQNPSTVQQFNITRRLTRQGIYAGRWTYSDNPQEDKFSTMFPDHCDQQQVLHSIAHAEAHRITCPSGAPGWAWCGLNRPDDATDDRRFCHARDGTRYTIAGASDANGRINTGFPLR